MSLNRINQEKLPKAFFLSIKTQFENVGDALIIGELITLLESYGKVYIDVSACPQHFVKNICHEKSENVIKIFGSTHLLSKMMKMAVISDNDVHFFFIPGGFNGEINRKQFLKGLLVNFIVKLFSIVKVRFHRLGVSYERIGQRHWKLIKNSFSVLHSCCVRDSISFDYVMSNIDVKSLRIAPDLAFNLFYDHQIIEASQSRHQVAVSLRCDKYNLSVEVISKTIVSIAEKSLINGTIVLVSQVARDFSFLSKLEAKLKNDTCFDVQLRDCSKSLVDANEIYEQCRYTISNRLHSLLLAASTGSVPVPLIDKNKDPKISGIFKDMGMSGAIIDINETDNIEIMDKFLIDDSPFKLMSYIESIVN